MKTEILPKYIPMLKKAKEKAEETFGDVKYCINSITIGNSGLNYEPDGERLAKCVPLESGLKDIVLSKKILSEDQPDKDDMETEIIATLVHEYAHVSLIKFSYKMDPLGMYKSLLYGNQLAIEHQCIHDFAERHSDQQFIIEYVQKRRNSSEDIASELVPEAYELTIRGYTDEPEMKEAMNEAEMIVSDYQNILEKATLIPFKFFILLLRIKYILDWANYIASLVGWIVIIWLLISLIFRIK